MKTRFLLAAGVIRRSRVTMSYQDNGEVVDLLAPFPVPAPARNEDVNG